MGAGMRRSPSSRCQTWWRRGGCCCGAGGRSCRATRWPPWSSATSGALLAPCQYWCLSSQCPICMHAPATCSAMHRTHQCWLVDVFKGGRSCRAMRWHRWSSGTSGTLFNLLLMPMPVLGTSFQISASASILHGRAMQTPAGWRAVCGCHLWPRSRQVDSTILTRLLGTITIHCQDC